MYNNKHEGLWYLLDKLADIADFYVNIKDNESERDTNTRLGKWAIKYNIIFFIFLGGAAALAIWAISLFKAESVLLGVLIIFLALGVAITSVIFAILAFASEITQMKLNKKPIGLISLLTTILIIIAAIASIAIAVTIF